MNEINILVSFLYLILVIRVAFEIIITAPSHLFLSIYSILIFPLRSNVNAFESIF